MTAAQSSPPPVSRWPAALAAGVILPALLAAYHNSFSGPFVFDDGPSIADNPTIRRLWPITEVLHPPTSAGVGGRPLLNVSFALNHAVSGGDVWSYHALNLAIHALAGLVLFGIVRRTLLLLGGRLGGDASRLALAAALLWSLHPIQTSSVTYLSQRAESLMGLFYLLTLYCFIRSVDVRGLAWPTASVLSCLLGLATKEVAVTAPLMVLLFDRTFVAKSWGELWRRRRRLHAALVGTWLLPAWLMSGLGSRGAGYGLGFTWWSYALTECRVVVRYLRLTVWPHPLVFDYGLDPAVGSLARDAAILAVLGAGVLIAFLRRPRLGYCGVWFFVILAPTSSVVPLAYQPMAENRLYLPLAGVVVLAVIGVHALLGRRAWVVLAALAAGCGCLTARRNADYRSDTTLWRDTVQKCPENAGAHNNLGHALMDAPDPRSRAEAVAEFQAAVRLDPDYVEAHDNLGMALSRSPDRLTEAVAEYQTALRLRPDYAEAHYNLGNALVRFPGRLDEALAEYREAVRCKPDYPRAYNNLGYLLSESPDRLPEAVKAFREALRLKPDYFRAHINLANVLARVPGRLPEAIAEYRNALLLDPDSEEARDGLARLQSTAP